MVSGLQWVRKAAVACLMLQTETRSVLCPGGWLPLLGLSCPSCRCSRGRAAAAHRSASHLLAAAPFVGAVQTASPPLDLRKEGGENYIMMVDRGPTSNPCKFAEKVRRAAAGCSGSKQAAGCAC